MRELVAKCLVKDPTKRPTAAQVCTGVHECAGFSLWCVVLCVNKRFYSLRMLSDRCAALHPLSSLQLLDHKFFKTAHDNQYLQKHLLVGLPPAPERVLLMRQGHVSGAGPRRCCCSCCHGCCWGLRQAVHVPLTCPYPDALAVESLSSMPALPCSHTFPKTNPTPCSPRPACPALPFQRRLLQAARQEVQDKDILASQQEYRKGVSSWNFDVAALKAAAAAAREEEDEQRLPPISEYSGGLMGTGGCRAWWVGLVGGVWLCRLGTGRGLPSPEEGLGLGSFRRLSLLLGATPPSWTPTPPLPCPTCRGV